MVVSTALLVAASASEVHGEPPRAPLLPAQAVSADVAAVAMLDLTKLTPADLDAAVGAILGKGADLLREPLAACRTFHADFTKAGGQRLALVVSWPVGARQPSDPAVFVGHRPDADSQEIAALGPRYWPAPRYEPAATKLTGGWVVFVPHQRTPHSDYPGTLQLAAVNAALSDASESAVAAAFIPNDTIRDLVAANAAALRPDSRELATQALAAKWISLSASAGASPTARLRIGLGDEAAARALSQTLARVGGQKVSASGPALERDDPQGMVMSLFAGLRPKVEETTVRLAAEPEDLRRMGEVLHPAVLRARQAALGVQSMNNLRQFGVVFHAYASAHGGQPPPTLDDMRTFLANDDATWQRLMTNPVTGEHPGYVYEKPAGDITKLISGEVIIMRELRGGKPSPAGANLYLDGSVRILSATSFDEARPPQTQPR